MPAKRVRHPGRVLLEDFLGPFEISQNRLGLQNEYDLAPSGSSL
jgi:plasmid maintenance system antidote protein VapI